MLARHKARLWAVNLKQQIKFEQVTIDNIHDIYKTTTMTSTKSASLATRRSRCLDMVHVLQVLAIFHPAPSGMPLDPLLDLRLPILAAAEIFVHPRVVLAHRVVLRGCEVEASLRAIISATNDNCSLLISAA